MRKWKDFFIKDSVPYIYELYKNSKCIVSEQIGLLQAVCYSGRGEVEITWFRVRQMLGEEKYRKCGIGRGLFEMLVCKAVEDGFRAVVVQPHPDPYEGDELVESAELYQIYWKLGFRFWIDGRIIGEGLTFEETVSGYGIDINKSNRMFYELN